ncbi:hypothetical protein KI387_016640, partial [Taxus chinensis]
MHRHNQQAMVILLEVIGLGPVAQMPSIVLDHGLLTVLVEQWHSENQCFRMLTGEMTVTIEDVWWILRMLMMGTLIEYSSDVGLIRVACSALFGVDDIPHDGMTITLQECISDPTLHRGPLYIMALINGFLLTDKICTLFSRGLLPLVHGIYSGERYYWGQCILAHIYWDLHLITYHSQKTMGLTSLLQIWSWDHIVIRCPMGPFRVQDLEEPLYMAWVVAGGDV